MDNRKFYAVIEKTKEVIDLTISERGDFFPESTRFNIDELKKKYKDLNGVTIREGYEIKDIGIDGLSAFINLRLTFERKE